MAPRWSATRLARSAGAARAGEAPPVFEPYGVTGDIPDPIARALNGLLDEVSRLQARVNEVERGQEPVPADEGAAAASEPVRRRVAGAQP